MNMEEERVVVVPKAAAEAKKNIEDEGATTVTASLAKAGTEVKKKEEKAADTVALAEAGTKGKKNEEKPKHDLCSNQGNASTSTVVNNEEEANNQREECVSTMVGEKACNAMRDDNTDNDDAENDEEPEDVCWLWSV